MMALGPSPTPPHGSASMDERAAESAVFSESGLAGPAVWNVPGEVRPLPASDAPEPLGRPLVPLKAASPRLSRELFTRLLGYGTPPPTAPPRSWPRSTRAASWVS